MQAVVFIVWPFVQTTVIYLLLQNEVPSLLCWFVVLGYGVHIFMLHIYLNLWKRTYELNLVTVI